MPKTTQFGEDGNEVQFDGSLAANTILLGRYKILGVLGGGGQGAVYQARDLNFPDAKRLVAVKEMRYSSPDPNLRASTMKTFQREGNILATLSHPAIPRIYDFFDQNDRAYLVMEYINGSDLEHILTKTKSIPIEKIIDWAIELCDVLHYLHSNQPEPIIFRDMKPANVMIDSLGKIRLIDFGIAKIFVSGVKNTMIGTEGYSAPEQYRGDVNPLSDIYSLGATLHHVITRQDPRLAPPFSFSERPLDKYNEEVAKYPGIIEIVEKALAFEPQNRFQDCATMKSALEALRYRPIVTVSSANGAPTTVTTKDGKSTVFFEGDFGGIQPRWIFKSEDEIRCSPVVYRDRVYVGSYDTNIWALNIEDGSLIWKYPTNGGIAASPVIDTDNRLVLFGSEDYTFTALDAVSGRINWSYTTTNRIRGTARVAHGHVFFGSDDGKLHALVAGNGRFLWDFDMGAEVRSRPWVTNELIIVGSDSGEVIALELSGNRKWGYRTKRAIQSSPFVDNEGVCYVGSNDGHLYALDASSGYSLWKFRTNGPVISSPIADDQFVYFGSADGNVYAVNTETGRQKWKFEVGKPVVASPALHNGQIYVGATDNKLYCIDAKTGKENWSFGAEGPITSAPFITESLILFGSMDHKLYALPLV